MSADPARVGDAAETANAPVARSSSSSSRPVGSCVRCGYDLRGQDPAGRCPECGEAVTITMRAWVQRLDRDVLEDLLAHVRVLAWTPLIVVAVVIGLGLLGQWVLIVLAVGAALLAFAMASLFFVTGTTRATGGRSPLGLGLWLVLLVFVACVTTASLLGASDVIVVALVWAIVGCFVAQASAARRLGRRGGPPALRRLAGVTLRAGQTGVGLVGAILLAFIIMPLIGALDAVDHVVRDLIAPVAIPVVLGGLFVLGELTAHALIRWLRSILATRPPARPH